MQAGFSMHATFDMTGHKVRTVLLLPVRRRFRIARPIPPAETGAFPLLFFGGTATPAADDLLRRRRAGGSGRAGAAMLPAIQTSSGRSGA